MKLTIVVLLVCFSVSQAFNPWGVFKKWKGEVEEALDSKEQNKHAERFVKEVRDRQIELMKEHEELGKDVQNKVHKVWKKLVTEVPEIIPTEPFEPDVKPTEIPNETLIPNESEFFPIEENLEEPEPTETPKDPEATETPEEPEPTETPEEPEPTETPEEPEPTETPEEPDFVEPTEEESENEPTEGYVDPEVEPSSPEAPEVPPTDDSEEIEEELEPTEAFPEVKPVEPEPELIEEPIEANESEEEDKEKDGLDRDDDYDDDDDLSEEVQPEIKVEEPIQVEVDSDEDVDFAPKETLEGLDEVPAHQWLRKRQLKLMKLWNKFNHKHSEKVFNKIRNLEKKIAMKRED